MDGVQGLRPSLQFETAPLKHQIWGRLTMASHADSGVGVRLPRLQLGKHQLDAAKQSSHGAFGRKVEDSVTQGVQLKISIVKLGLI